MQTTTEACHSLEQAKAQLEHIQLWHEIHQWAVNQQEPKDLSREARRFILDELDWAADPDHEAIAEAIRERVNEHPLEIQVRSDWHALGETPETAEFYILLCTGGPAVRIRGELRDGCVVHCWLEHQDWGTPWANCYLQNAENALTWYDALTWYAECFYWEEA